MVQISLLRFILHLFLLGLSHGKILEKTVLKKVFGGHGVDAIAISEKYIVLGSQFHGEGGEAAICENKPGYRLLAKLAPKDVKEFDSFGFSIAVNNKFAVVGCRRCDGKYKNQGSVYIYSERNGNWTYEKLTAVKGGRGYEFGGSVAINDKNELVVGSRNAAETGQYSGTAYLYQYEGKWIIKQRLIPRELQSNDFYGNAVSITEDYIAVAAQYSSILKPFVEKAGKVYIFRRDLSGIWFEDGKVISANPEAYGGFGEAIDIDGRRLIVGAGTENVETGNAYIFVRIDKKWKLETTLDTLHKNKRAIFGSAVALHKNIAAVATTYAYGDPYAEIGIGYFYKLVAGKWIEIDELKIYKRDLVSSVDIYDGNVVAGCINDSYLFSEIEKK